MTNNIIVRFGINFIILMTATLLPFLPVFAVLADEPLSLIDTQPGNAFENESYSWAITAKGGQPPYSCKIVGKLPPGLSFDRASCTIVGTPAVGLDADKYTFNVAVTDNSSPALAIELPLSISVQYKSVISVTSSLSTGEANTYVDGQRVSGIRGGSQIKLLFPSGTRHTVSVDNPTPVSGDDSIKFNPIADKITIDGRSPDAKFDFSPVYNIHIECNHTDMPALPGAGWYSEGNVLSSAAPAQIESKPGVQYRFAYWQLPAGEVYGNPNLSWKINKGGTVTAVYDTYYQLTANSEYCDVEGSGWQKADSKARWNIACSQSVPAPGFWGGLGVEMKPEKSSGTVLMDSPKEIDVTWNPDYTRIVIPVVTGVICATIIAILGLLHSRIKELIGRNKI